MGLQLLAFLINLIFVLPWVEWSCFLQPGDIILFMLPRGLYRSLSVLQKGIKILGAEVFSQWHGKEWRYFLPTLRLL